MNKGFTLIEVMVSVMIFSVVMTVALGALLAMSQSDQRAEALKTVVNNLNFALDSMTRTIRTGYDYHCGNSGDLSTPGPQDCAGAGNAQNYLALRDAKGQLVAYCLYGNALVREQPQSGPLSASCAAADFYPLTSSEKEITITNMQFIVTGSCPLSGGGCVADSIQPKVTILMSGTFSISPTQVSQFNLETSVTQRVYDQ
jgi:prepilin-type N-terminal cleavage/methylation domain-containing protein